MTLTEENVLMKDMGTWDETRVILSRTLGASWGMRSTLLSNLSFSGPQTIYPPYDSPKQVTNLAWLGVMMNVSPPPSATFSLMQLGASWTDDHKCLSHYSLHCSQLTVLPQPYPLPVPGPCFCSDNLSPTISSFLSCRRAEPWNIEQGGLEIRRASGQWIGRMKDSSFLHINVMAQQDWGHA